MKKADIPFHRPFIGEEEIQEVVDTLKKGWLTMGPKTIEFEKRFSAYVKADDAIAMNSCTAALHLALTAIGLQPGDEVIVPAITFTATAEVICYFDAVPVIVDIEPDYRTMDVNAFEKAITPKTRAVIPVHFGGHPAEMDSIIEIARQKGIYVIEDAAHSLPAYYKGNIIGSLSDMTAFSFYATKTLSTGEGGMLTTDHPEIAEKVRIMRLHGISKDAWKRYEKDGSWAYDVVAAGFKYNTTDINSSLGLRQLDRVDSMMSMRKQIKDLYYENLKGCDVISLPVERSDCQSAWHLYPICLNTKALKIDRDEFIRQMKARGIGVSVHFIPLYRFTYYRETFNLTSDQFPNSEAFYAGAVSLPIFPGMSKEEVDTVSCAVLEICNKYEK